MVIKDRILNGMEIHLEEGSGVTLKTPTTISPKGVQNYKIHGYYSSIESAIKSAAEKLLEQRLATDIVTIQRYITEIRLLKSQIEKLLDVK